MYVVCVCDNKYINIRLVVKENLRHIIFIYIKINKSKALFYLNNPKQ